MRPLGSEPMTLTRPAAGSRDAKGRWVEGATSPSTIYGSWQPASGKDREGLPQGLRQKDARKIFTSTELKCADQYAGSSGDVLTIDGVDYEVITVSPWRAVIAHHECVAVRVSEAA